LHGVREQADDPEGDARRMQVRKEFAYFGGVSGFERSQHALQMIRFFVSAASPW